MQDFLDPNELIEIARVGSGANLTENNEIADQQRRLYEDIVRKNTLKQNIDLCGWCA
jgi:hypothetical protein